MRKSNHQKKKKKKKMGDLYLGQQPFYFLPSPKESKDERQKEEEWDSK
jgi:hypothetical protein